MARGLLIDPTRPVAALIREAARRLAPYAEALEVVVPHLNPTRTRTRAALASALRELDVDAVGTGLALATWDAWHREYTARRVQLAEHARATAARKEAGQRARREFTAQRVATERSAREAMRPKCSCSARVAELEAMLDEITNILKR
jgi:hypothetical protein